MRRLKCEKETIILTNEDDGFYDVYTFNQSLQKRLRAFAERSIRMIAGWKDLRRMAVKRI